MARYSEWSVQSLSTPPRPNIVNFTHIGRSVRVAQCLQRNQLDNNVNKYFSSLNSFLMLFYMHAMLQLHSPF